MSIEDFTNAIVGNIPAGPTAYRLCFQTSEGVSFIPPQSLPALRLKPFDLPLAKTGEYAVAYEYDQRNVKLLLPKSVTWEVPSASQAEYTSEGIDAGKSFTHLRLVVTKTFGDNKYFNLAELAVFEANKVVYDPENE